MLQWLSRKMKKRKGFTLVELVVVIAILGILAGIAVPKLGSSRNTAKIAAHNTNIRILKSTAAMYLADYPNTEKTELTEEDLKDYLDGEKFPKVPSGLKNDEDKPIDEKYSITIDEKGNIIIEPKEITPKEETNSGD